MSLSERTPARTTRKGPRCGVCTIVEKHPDDEAVIESWRVAGHGWQEITAAVNAEHGSTLPWATMSRHVRGLCEGRRAR